MLCLFHGRLETGAAHSSACLEMSVGGLDVQVDPTGKDDVSLDSLWSRLGAGDAAGPALLDDQAVRPHSKLWH